MKCPSYLTVSVFLRRRQNQKRTLLIHSIHSTFFLFVLQLLLNILYTFNTISGGSGYYSNHKQLESYFDRGSSILAKYKGINYIIDTEYQHWYNSNSSKKNMLQRKLLKISQNQKIQSSSSCTMLSFQNFNSHKFNKDLSLYQDKRIKKCDTKKTMSSTSFLFPSSLSQIHRKETSFHIRFATTAAFNLALNETTTKENIVFTHLNSDFDSFAAAVGLCKILQKKYPDIPSFVCMPQGAHPAVDNFLALHSFLFPIKVLSSVNQDKIYKIGIVDASSEDRIGAEASKLLPLADEVIIFDHHDNVLIENKNLEKSTSKDEVLSSSSSSKSFTSSSTASFTPNETFDFPSEQNSINNNILVKDTLLKEKKKTIQVVNKPQPPQARTQTQTQTQALLKNEKENTNTTILSTYSNVQMHQEDVGSITTAIVEILQNEEIPITEVEATLFALGIHTDTGSLTFDRTTSRDAKALAWLLERNQGAKQKVIFDYCNQRPTEIQEQFLLDSLKLLSITNIGNRQIGTIMFVGNTFIPGMARVAQTLLQITTCDCIIWGYIYPQTHQNVKRPKKKNTALKSGKNSNKENNTNKNSVGDGSTLPIDNANTEATNKSILEDSPQENSANSTQGQNKYSLKHYKMSLIGRVRSNVDDIDVSKVLSEIGGGGHEKAAAATFRLIDQVHPTEKREEEEKGRGVGEVVGQRAKIAKDQNDDIEVISETIGQKTLENYGHKIMEKVLMNLELSLKESGKENNQAKYAYHIMTTKLLTIEKSITLREAAKILQESSLNSIPVIEGHQSIATTKETTDENKVVGIISYVEILKAQKANRLDSPVSAYMVQKFPRLSMHATIDEIKQAMIENSGRMLIITSETDNTKLVGVISRRNLLNQYQFYSSIF